MRNAIVHAERARLLITRQRNTKTRQAFAGEMRPLSPPASPLGLLAQLAEQLRCKEKISRFESGAVHRLAMAEWLRRMLWKHETGGSSPPGQTGVRSARAARADQRMVAQ